jgi:CDP-4-dehydro-6-deoxyglucose reductase, E1
MSLELILKKLFKKKSKTRSHHKFPLKDSTFRDKDLIEGIKVILSKNMTMSDITKKFEKLFSKDLKTSYSTMVNSGSSANLLAIQCLINPYRKNRLNKGDEVLIPAVCWPTSFWPIIQSGLKPVFVDVEKETFNICLKDLEKKISKKTKALMLVHVLGNSPNMDKLMKMINRRKIILIEDTCESIGAKYKGKFLGTFGEFSSFSFYYSHQISSVEGGMISCKTKSDEDIIKSLRSHGWARGLSNQKYIEKSNKNINKKFLFVNSGFNFRPTDIQASIGISQFKSLQSFIKVRVINRNKLIKSLTKDPRWNNQVKFVDVRKNLKPSWFGLSMLLNPKYKSQKRTIFLRLDKHGIENRPIISGNFLKQPALKKYNIKQKSINFPNANYIHELGFFVGLKSSSLTSDQISKFTNLFFKSFKGL